MNKPARRRPAHGVRHAGSAGRCAGVLHRRSSGPTAAREQLADLQRRYTAVGGTSQLAARTAEQVAGVQAALD